MLHDGPCMLPKEDFCEVSESKLKMTSFSFVFFFFVILKICLPGDLASALAVSINPMVNFFSLISGP